MRSWRTILAAFGIALAVALPTAKGFAQEAQPQEVLQNADPQPIDDEVEGHNILERPCEFGRDDRSSDLCAQWKAADAAAASVIVAEKSFWSGVVGLVISSITFVTAVAAAIYARGAMIETRRMGEAQSRAYLGEEKTEFLFSVNQINGERSINNCVVSWKNYGESPAFIIKSGGGLFGGDGATEERISRFKNDAKGKFFSTYAVFPNKMTNFGDSKASPQDTMEWMAGRQQLMVYSFVVYSDIFGMKWFSESCNTAHYITQNGKNIVRFSPYNSHNSGPEPFRGQA